MPGADVQVFSRIDWNNNFKVDTTKTDQNGLFRFQSAGVRGGMILVRSGDQQLSSGNDFYTYSTDMRPKPFEQTVFFTDRSLYRPGQTIQYKGLCLAVDQEQNNYKTIANRALTVIFTDPNNKEIARQQVKTNDYGSFSGSFTAPRDRLTGQMYLRVDGTPPGGTVVRVEEYKRPKFQVTLEAPKAAPRSTTRWSCPARPWPTPERPSTAPRSIGTSFARSTIPFGGTGPSGGARPTPPAR